MARLIDADATLPIIDNYAKTVDGEHKEVIKAIRDIVEVISPTVDAVEVVRCKDCRYLSRNKFYCTRFNIAIIDNGFCHKGERKESE